MDAYEFDDAVAVRGNHPTWSAEVPSGWDIGGNANGGYVLALGANALRAVAERPDPVTVTGHYLAPVTPGPVEIPTEVVKTGKRLSVVSGSIRREGRELIRLLGAFGDVAAQEHDFEWVDGAPPELPPLEQCVRRTVGGTEVQVRLMDRIDIMLHPDDAGLNEGAPSGSGRVRGWFSFRDGRPVDTLSLLLVADAFPPAVFTLPGLVRGWVPTVEFTVHVRGVPAPGPVRCEFRSRFVTGGALEEDGQVWDSRGRLVAISRQYGLLART